MGKPTFDHLQGALRPALRGKLHAAGAVLVPVVAVFLCRRAHNTTQLVSVAVYCVALFAVYAISATYHVFMRSERTQRIFQRIDHAAIFLLIAGTYTPVCLLAVPAPWAAVMLSGVWALAILGFTLKVSGRAWKFATALYLVLGWSAVTALPAIYHYAGFGVAALFIGGGVIYTVGAVLFLTGRPRMRSMTYGYHELWHTFTLCAGAAHFAGVTLLLT